MINLDNKEWLKINNIILAINEIDNKHQMQIELLENLRVIDLI